MYVWSLAVLSGLGMNIDTCKHAERIVRHARIGS